MGDLSSHLLFVMFFVEFYLTLEYTFFLFGPFANGLVGEGNLCFTRPKVAVHYCFVNKENTLT